MQNSVAMKPFFAAALLAAVSVYASRLGLPGASVLESEAIKNATFPVIAFALVTLSGLLLLAASQRNPGVLVRSLLGARSRVELGYLAVAGAVAGWAFAIITLALANGGLRLWSKATVLGGYTLLLVLGPLFIYEHSLLVFKTHSRIRFSPRKGAALLLAMGIAVFALGGLGFASWLRIS